MPVLVCAVDIHTYSGHMTYHHPPTDKRCGTRSFSTSGRSGDERHGCPSYPSPLNPLYAEWWMVLAARRTVDTANPIGTRMVQCSHSGKDGFMGNFIRRHLQAILQTVRIFVQLQAKPTLLDCTCHELGSTTCTLGSCYMHTWVLLHHTLGPDRKSVV